MISQLVCWAKNWPVKKEHVTNASKVREWPFPQGKQGAGGPHPGLWRDRLRALADTLERVHFSEPPELDLHFAEMR